MSVSPFTACGVAILRTVPIDDALLVQQVDLLDHVLVSEQFYDNSYRRLWLFDGLIIINDHLNDADAAARRLKGSSDHGLVRVTFRYQAARDE